jgi:hypothetical protein
MASNLNSADSEVFVYTGEGGESPPHNVVRVRVDPSVTSIPAYAFDGRKKLAEVELSEGLIVIGAESFMWCNNSITKINIPATIKRICDNAFKYSLQCPICLHDGIESIGEYAFACCIFTNFRVPPLITVIPNGILSNCSSLFSLELSESVMKIKGWAFNFCYCLRNVAFPPNAVFEDYIFGGQSTVGQTDLYQLFGSIAEIISELQHRFDGLPIHRLVYYQSYYQGVLQNLIAAINMRSGQRRTLCSKLDPTGNQQDCLGMTPLHILTCSSRHNIEIYRVIVQKYPTNLITEDRWGALPLLYAFWGAAPAEIVQFLLESYRSLYPDHIFNWTMMVETIGRCDTPKESIENLLQVKQMHFPDQPIDWDHLLNGFSLPSIYSLTDALFQKRMKFLFICGMSTHVESLAFKVWRDKITNMIQTANFQFPLDNTVILRRIQAKVAHFEEELLELKEVTTILEIGLWKMKINALSLRGDATHNQKKIKTDESSTRQQCRVTCGADVVIGHVLPFLITA